ncbi:MAG: chemotaxis protein CheW [Synechococcales bacterium]|nr:chemotaxis protein CheW [Synechococcales bacterium]
MNHLDSPLVQEAIDRSVSQQLLRFSLSEGHQVLLPTQHLLEILGAAQTPIIPIPDMPAAVMGVCNWRGEILWLVDLSCYLGFGALSFTNLQRKSFKTLIAQAGQQRVGFVVAQVEQMIWLERSQLLPVPNPPMNPVLARSLQGYYADPVGNMLLVLDGIAVINTLQAECRGSQVTAG